MKCSQSVDNEVDMCEYTDEVADLITEKVPNLHNALSKKSYISVFSVIAGAFTCAVAVVWLKD